MLNKISFVTLFVKNQDKALDFYTKVLGFEKRGDNPAPNEDGVRFLTVGVAGQDTQIVLWPGTPGTGIAKGTVPGTLIIDTADCKKAFAALKERGAKFETSEVIEQPYAFSAVVVDPDGNRLMLRQTR